jgi:hypothetical protein
VGTKCWDQIAEGYSITSKEKMQRWVGKRWGVKVSTTR